jgi:hypothetical protein
VTAAAAGPAPAAKVVLLRHHCEWQPRRAEMAAGGGADRKSAKNAAGPHGSIARSAPCGAAAPLPRRGLPDLARKHAPVFLNRLVEVANHVVAWTSSSPRTRPSGALSRTGHQASSGSICIKTRSPGFQRWRLCQPAAERPRQSVRADPVVTTSSYSPQGRPAGGRLRRPSSAKLWNAY